MEFQRLERLEGLKKRQTKPGISIDLHWNSHENRTSQAADFNCDSCRTSRAAACGSRTTNGCCTQAERNSVREIRVSQSEKTIPKMGQALCCCDCSLIPDPHSPSQQYVGLHNRSALRLGFFPLFLTSNSFARLPRTRFVCFAVEGGSCRIGSHAYRTTVILWVC